MQYIKENFEKKGQIKNSEKKEKSKSLKKGINQNFGKKRKIKIFEKKEKWKLKKGKINFVEKKE